MVDLTFLEEFTKGDISKMKRYIALYLDVAPETFSKMRRNLDEKDWNHLRINAHSLKPQADFMGLLNLKKVLKQIEDSINQNQFDNLTILYGNAFNFHQESEAVLREFIDNNSHSELL